MSLKRCMIKKKQEFLPMSEVLDLSSKIQLLNTLSMQYETAVIDFPADGYPNAFFDYFEIKDRDLKLIPSELGFHETLKEVSGYDVWQLIADLTEEFFGEPKRVTVFEDDKSLRDELEGPEGLAPFFFIFDLMFCEYDDFTLCFISGSNN